MSSPERKVDRYGWYHSGEVPSEEEQNLRKAESKREGLREQKWVNMFAKWDVYTGRKRNKLAERVKKGIPDSMRSKAWPKILGCDGPLGKDEPNLHELLKRERREVFYTIDKDLMRSFPQIGFFSQEGFIESLRRVLYGYAQADTELGYTQGMNFLAGMLLAYLDEETAFRAMYIVMNGKRILQREFLTPGFPRLNVAISMFEELLRKKYSKISRNIEANGISSAMYAAGWFLPAFQSFTWLPQLQIMIFERYLFYGLRSLLSFGLVIVERHKKQLEKGDLEVILGVLHRPDESASMQDWRSVVKDWDDLWIKKAQYTALLKIADAPPEEFF